ncbi:hypothetical protein [Streptomyces neyagawaensis]|uniref:Uncharacterized protein n=1 Tax=Streptomyces neyagawaensis TaxID=42238 RepID=A0ABV3BD35_9ACTN
MTWVLRVGATTDKLTGLGQQTPSLSALVTAVGQAVAERMEKPA